MCDDDDREGAAGRVGIFDIEPIGGRVMSTEPRDTTELRGVIPQLALVEYQPDAVVSRTLIKKPAGTGVWNADSSR
jgi:hypothetical protein